MLFDTFVHHIRDDLPGQVMQFDTVSTGVAGFRHVQVEAAADSSPQGFLFVRCCISRLCITNLLDFKEVFLRSLPIHRKDMVYEGSAMCACSLLCGPNFELFWWFSLLVQFFHKDQHKDGISLGSKQKTLFPPDNLLEKVGLFPNSVHVLVGFAHTAVLLLWQTKYNFTRFDFCAPLTAAARTF